jgi:hypothetical protein
MRALFSVVGLLIVVAIIGMIAKKQLTAIAPTAPVTVSGAPAPAMSPQNQVQAMKQAAEAALQTPRPMPDDSK